MLDQYEFTLLFERKEEVPGIIRITTSVMAEDFDKAYNLVKGYFGLDNHPEIQIDRVDKYIWRKS